MPLRLLRFGFFLLYNHLAFTYEWVARLVSLGQWSRWRQTAAPFLLPGPTLELAFGTGRLMAQMSGAGHNWVGIDLSPFMARITANHLNRQNLPLNAAQASTVALPFAAGQFCNVVATFPTDYIFQSQTLAEINRVLQPGEQARLIVVAQGQLRGPKPVNAAIEWLYRITGQRGTNRAAVIARFAAAGFEAAWHAATQQGASAWVIIAHRKLQVRS